MVLRDLRLDCVFDCLVGLATFLMLALAALSHREGVQIVAYVLIAVGFLNIAVMFVTPVLARRAASWTLGIKITMRKRSPARHSGIRTLVSE